MSLALSDPCLKETVTGTAVETVYLYISHSLGGRAGTVQGMQGREGTGREEHGCLLEDGCRMFPRR